MQGFETKVDIKELNHLTYDVSARSRLCLASSLLGEYSVCEACRASFAWSENKT